MKLKIYHLEVIKMKKTTNLRIWMFLKAIPAVLLLLYYWLCTVEGYNPVFRYIHALTLVLAGGLVWWQISYAKKNAIFDEFGLENLKTTDSICMRIAFILMTVAALVCVFANFDGIIAGYFVVGGILVLAVTRAVIFSVIDRKGM